MKLFSAHRSTMHITHYVMCMVVLIGLAWTGHVRASPLQDDRQMSVVIEQPMIMTACLPCASCYVAPPPVAGILGNGDHPALVSAATLTRFVAQTDSYVVAPDVSVWPTLALRVLYCRWLN